MKGDKILISITTIIVLMQIFSYGETIVHIYIGLLFGMYAAIDKKIPGNRHLLYAATYLTLLEIVAFTASRVE